MNTLLNSAQQAQVDQFRSFARQHLTSVSEKLVSREACLKEFLQKLGQQGYLGLHVAKEYGGSGGTLLDVVLLVEALAEMEPGLGLTIGNHVAVIETIQKFGTEQQKSKYLPLLARGEQFATLAFSEESAGTDFQAVQATVRGASDLTLTASKRWVVTGDFAGLFLVLAKSEENKLVMVLVDRAADGAAFELLKDHKLMGLSSAYVNDVEFTDLPVNATNKIVGDGAEVALFAMDVAKVVLASAAIGLIDGAKGQAVGHAREREQFGTTIGQFQGVQWKLADLECDRVGARLLVQRAAWSLHGEPGLFRQYASMCKFFAARAARLHSGEALQIMGAAGLEANSLTARFYNDAKMMEVAEGTSEFQKMLLVKELNI